MCGLAGFWSRQAPDAAVAERMATRLISRGPGDAGAWLEEGADLALLHGPLFVVELLQAGSHPMISLWVCYEQVFNGEIYNHRAVRSEVGSLIGGFDWLGHFDTDTLLATLRYWGLEQALTRLNGMFAFALWDLEEYRPFLAGDRMAQSPLISLHPREALIRLRAQGARRASCPAGPHQSESIGRAHATWPYPCARVHSCR